ncbi:MAG: TlpA disulfide reductase family protein [Fodinibius sp.]|nr:TlpA disulfide reductase family protein [Fodinibius sp.]
MRIDPKYFNVFLVIVAVIAAVLIAVFTMSNRSAEKSAFKERMFQQDSLQTLPWPNVESADSLRISDFQGDVVVLDFWASWSDASLQSHRQLAELKNQYPDTLQVLAASVSLQKAEVSQYIKQHQFPFHFVAGSRYFSDLKIPGLPAQLIYRPDGELQHVFLGYPGPSQYDSLRAMITNGKQ